MHWYDVADQLFVQFDVPASAPLTDWFLRPTTASRERTPGDYAAGWTRCRTHSPGSSPATTVIYQAHPTSEPRRPTAPGQENTPNIAAWLEGQPDSVDVDDFEMLDPTPGGYVSPRSGRTTCSQATQTDPEIYIFNPQATPFQSRAAERTSSYTSTLMSHQSPVSTAGSGGSHSGSDCEGDDGVSVESALTTPNGSLF